MRRSHSDLSRLFMNAIYSPSSSPDGVSTSSWDEPSGAYKSSARPVCTSTFHHVSAVYASPRNRFPDASVSGSIWGTAQYATSSVPGAHAHLSAVVRRGSVTVFALSFTRAESVKFPEL